MHDSAVTRPQWSWKQLLISFGLLYAQGQASAMHRRQVYLDDGYGPEPEAEVPAEDDFSERGRRQQSMAVIGDYLYLHGGLLASKTAPFNRTSINGTYYVPLSESWSNSTVSMGWIEHDWPSRFQPTLWPDPEAKILYSWGGTLVEPANPADRYLWQLTPDEEGVGEWSIHSPANQEVYDDLGLGQAGADTVCGGYGIKINGIGLPMTDSRFGDEMDGDPTAIGGVTMYDFSSRTWANESTAEVFPGVSLWYARAVCATGFPTDAIVLTFGGLQANLRDVGDTTMRSLGTVHLFNPIDKTWFAQETFGDVPPPRTTFCAVGVRGQDTYNIYMYGGLQNALGLQPDEMYILSLPAFQWFRAPVSSPARMNHACALAGGRQMIVSGGYSFNERDPWLLSLGVFDLTTLQWRSQYSADAAAYETPRVIQDFYAFNGYNSTKWTSDEVRDMFVESDSPSTTGGTSTSTPQATGDTNRSPPSDSSESSSPSAISVGAIAGGIVGGIAALGLILAAAFFFLRQRRRNAGFRISPEAKQPFAEVKQQGHPAEVEGKAFVEADPANIYRPELHSFSRAELPG